MGAAPGNIDAAALELGDSPHASPSRAPPPWRYAAHHAVRTQAVLTRPALHVSRAVNERIDLSIEISECLVDFRGSFIVANHELSRPKLTPFFFTADNGDNMLPVVKKEVVDRFSDTRSCAGYEVHAAHETIDLANQGTNIILSPGVLAITH